MKARLFGVAAVFAFFGGVSPLYADQLGALTNDWSIVVPLAVVIGVIWFVVRLFKKEKQHTAVENVMNVVRKRIEPLAAEYAFIFFSADNDGILCMDREGERLRFVNFNLLDGSTKMDLTVPVENIISVELTGGHEVVTDYETTSTKPNALAGAVVGGLLFGGAGAIVGSTAAGSEETTVATQRVVEKPSILVFELTDLANPVVRFTSTDRAKCDLWLHRVRSAMARKKGHTVAA